MGPPILEALLLRAGKRFGFDFDDAIYLPNVSSSNLAAAHLKNTAKTSRIIDMSSAVSAGNRWLAEYASRFNSNVRVVPTTIDTEWYRPTPSRDPKRVVLGWTGSTTTTAHLRLLDDVLRRLQERYSVTIRVIGSSTYSVPGAEVQASDWNPVTETADLGSFDVGMMPLPNDEWARGKCGLKALQCMAMGVPTVCSPVGVNTEIIEHGSSGFLASTDSDWYDTLALLIEDANRRREIGEAGRQRVVERYSVQRWAPIYVDWFQALCAA